MYIKNERKNVKNYVTNAAANSAQAWGVLGWHASDFQRPCVLWAACDTSAAAAAVVPPCWLEYSPFSGVRDWWLWTYPKRETYIFVRSTLHTDGSLWKWICVIAPTPRWSVSDLWMLMEHPFTSNVVTCRVNSETSWNLRRAKNSINNHNTVRKVTKVEEGDLVKLITALKISGVRIFLGLVKAPNPRLAQ